MRNTNGGWPLAKLLFIPTEGKAPPFCWARRSIYMPGDVTRQNRCRRFGHCSYSHILCVYRSLFYNLNIDTYACSKRLSCFIMYNLYNSKWVKHVNLDSISVKMLFYTLCHRNTHWTYACTHMHPMFSPSHVLCCIMQISEQIVSMFGKSWLSP